MREGEVISSAADVVSALPRRIRRAVEAIALTTFFALVVLGRADDAFVWLWRALSETVSAQLTDAVASFGAR